MKPEAWILKTGHGTSVVQVKPACEVDLWEPLYSAETIRKWLLEVTEEMAEAAHRKMFDGAGIAEVYIAMIAIKLEELK